MSSDRFPLSSTPNDERGKELWLQHAAGFIIFQDVRAYALERLPQTLEPACRAVAEKAIDDAVYGLMMVIDGVSGGLRNSKYMVELGASARLREVDSDEIDTELDLASEGMCMGFHMWKEGDFGDEHPAITKAANSNECSQPIGPA